MLRFIRLPRSADIRDVIANAASGKGNTVSEIVIGRRLGQRIGSIEAEQPNQPFVVEETLHDCLKQTPNANDNVTPKFSLGSSDHIAIQSLICRAERFSYG